MMTKEQYIEDQIQGALEDIKYTKQILKEYFTNQVKTMTNGQFKDHLEELNLLD